MDEAEREQRPRPPADDPARGDVVEAAGALVRGDPGEPVPEQGGEEGVRPGVDGGDEHRRDHPVDRAVLDDVLARPVGTGVEVDRHVRHRDQRQHHPARQVRGRRPRTGGSRAGRDGRGGGVHGQDATSPAAGAGSPVRWIPRADFPWSFAGRAHAHAPWCCLPAYDLGSLPATSPAPARRRTRPVRDRASPPAPTTRADETWTRPVHAPGEGGGMGVLEIGRAHV